MIRYLQKRTGFLQDLNFFDVKKVAPDLAEKINLSTLGNRNGAAIIKYLLDTKDRTAHVTATPYKMQTTWSVAGETDVLDGTTPFTAQNTDFTLYARWEPAKNPKDPQTQVKVGAIKEVDSISYKVTDVGKNTVEAVGIKNKKLKKINVPNTIQIDQKTYAVTEIANNAFKKCTQATQATIGKNVKKIGSSAFFGCKQLKKVIFKCSVVKKIGKKAFKRTNAKMTVKVPKKLKKNKAFKKKLISAGMSKKLKIK